MAQSPDYQYASPEAAELSGLLDLTSPASDSQNPLPGSVPQSYQIRILNDHHVKFREKLNFMSILPHLNERGLIWPPGEYSKLQNLPSTDTNFSKIDKLIEIIPKCGRDDFLLRLIHCLRKSAAEANEAHHELANSLQEALDEYNPSIADTPPLPVGKGEDGHDEFELVNPESSLLINHREGGRSTSADRAVNQPGSRRGRYRQRCCLWSCCYFISFTPVLLGIVGMVSLSQLPCSTLAPPFLLQRVSSSLTELDFGLVAGWISTVQVHLDRDQCTGFVHVIPGKACKSLPIQTDSNIFFNNIYLLVGSQITITVGPDFEANSVWLLSSISVLEYFKTIPDFGRSKSISCHFPITRQDSDYKCFEADKYNTTNPIVFNVQHSGYYSIFVPGLSYKGLLSSVAARTYNFTAIVEQNLISRNVTFPGGGTQQISVSNQWEFTITAESCVLFEPKCMSFITVNLTVLAVQKRTDVLLFPALLFVCSALVLIPLMIIHVLWCIYKMLKFN